MRQLAVYVIWIIATGSSFAQDESAAPPTGAPSDSAFDTSVSAAIQEQLHALRERMFAAYQTRDMDALLGDVAPNVVITWQNGDRNNGHEEFREFYDRMMNGENRIVKDISTHFEVDDTSLVYGDNTAIARGTQADTFALNDGSSFTLNSKWTATVIKENDAWKVASYHVSANIFDNPILDFAKGWLMKAGIGGGIAGLIIGLMIGRATRRKPTAA